MGRRNNRRGHKSGNDLISDGMKYATMFGVAHEGFSAFSQHKGNSSQQRDGSAGDGMLSSLGGMLMSGQQQQRDQPQPRGNPQQQPMSYQQGSMSKPQQQQQQGIQCREQVVHMQDDVAPPPYSMQPKVGPQQDTAGLVSGHQDWCNGQCTGGCKLAAKIPSGEAASYYNGEESVKSCGGDI